MANNESALSQKFFAYGKEPIEVTGLFNPFKWMWSYVLKVIQYKE